VIADAVASITTIIIIIIIIITTIIIIIITIIIITLTLYLPSLLCTPACGSTE
jgi:hypothetical protein